MGFTEVIKGISGLTHYYPLDAVSQAKDVVGSLHGVNHGVVFGSNGATFDGKSYIEIPSHKDLSAVTTGAISILVFNTITDWKGAGASEYVHWLGKGVSGAHEYTYRHYVEGGTGEAPTRQNRTSFYCFNTAGGLGAGSYFQDPDGSAERVIVGQYDKTTVEMWKNGVKRDSDALSGYSITLSATSTPVRLGTRDMQTGFLVGRLRRVAFFDRKLTAAEITTLYNARAQAEGGTVIVPPPVVPPTTTNKAQVLSVDTEYPLLGVNVPRTTNALVIYTQPQYTQTPTNRYGQEAVVTNGVVVSVIDRLANSIDTGTPIPVGSVVLSGHGTAQTWMRNNVKVGTLMRFPGTVSFP